MDKISTIVKYYIPEFIRVKYPQFIQFIEEYFKFNEEKGNYLYFLENFQRNQDVDTCDEEFLDKYFDEYAEHFPKQALIDKRKLLKLLHEFYLSRGSEDSFRFLFRVLYNEEIEFYIPRNYLFVASDGRYLNDTYVYISSTNYYKLKQKIKPDTAITIEGKTSGSKATINKIEELLYVGTSAYLKLNVSDYDKDFIPNEVIVLTVDTEQVEEVIYGLIANLNITSSGLNYELEDTVLVDGSCIIPAEFKLTSVSKGGFEAIDIIDSGRYYQVGDEVFFSSNALDNNGSSFYAIVKVVGDDGKVLDVEILNSGYNYDKYPKMANPNANALYVNTILGMEAIIRPVSTKIGNIKKIEIVNPGLGYTTNVGIGLSSNIGVGAVIEPIIGCVFKTKKTYRAENGFLSTFIKLHDSYYYQIYSYDIKSSVPFNKWKDIVKKNLHPAGYEMFGSLIIENEIPLFAVTSENELIRPVIPQETIIEELFIDSINIEDISRVYNLMYCLNPDGYNNLDEIKFIIADPISKYFNLTISDLVCGEKVINTSTIDIIQNTI